MIIAIVFLSGIALVLAVLSIVLTRLDKIMCLESMLFLVKQRDQYKRLLSEYLEVKKS